MYAQRDDRFTSVMLHAYTLGWPLFFDIEFLSVPPFKLVQIYIYIYTRIKHKKLHVDSSTRAHSPQSSSI
jgi:hypothetical protein